MSKGRTDFNPWMQLPILPKAYPDQMSGGQQAIVAIFSLLWKYSFLCAAEKTVRYPTKEGYHYLVTNTMGLQELHSDSRHGRGLVLFTTSS
jgi:hypothetical protein